ncbi:MAG: hypothetical protein IJ752_09850 [Alphaproteobacteria bacterium]|nr:hypothetical protein [Alphaproteobacteria bacterium]
MTEETQTPTAAQEQTPAAADNGQAPANPAGQAKSEAVAKAQEVGKKLTGFLGGLAEKAKNIDVKELAEKAKNIDVKELTEKAKQKVNEVKDKASELNAGKAENVVPPRETMSGDQMKQLFTTVAQTADEFPAVVLAVLADLAQGDQVALKMKFGSSSDPVYVVLSAKNLYQFTKSSDQFQAYIHPVSEVRGFSMLAPRGETAGRLTIFLKHDEIKLTLGTLESYAKALMLYKKIRDTIEK